MTAEVTFDIRIRPIRPEDAQLFGDFVERIPEGDRTFFKEDLLDEGVMAFLLAGQRGIRLGAVTADGRIAGYGAVLPGMGWSSHVGDVRLVVVPEMRRQGVGRRLAQRLVVEALRHGIGKLVVEVVADQQAAVLMFQDLGFEAEALLRDHVRDRDGRLHDLLLLAHPVTERSEELATIGIGEPLL
jgi:ribosomal protein S18 acetylase RimI-like enzyme